MNPIYISKEEGNHLEEDYNSGKVISLNKMVYVLGRKVKRLESMIEKLEHEMPKSYKGWFQ